MNTATISSVPAFSRRLFQVELTALPLPNAGKIHVLREDLLDGGTKSRALEPYLRELIERGYREFTYATPFAGFAQLALAYACRDLKVHCQLFAEADPNQGSDRLLPHDITREAIAARASVTLLPTLSQAETWSAHWQTMTHGRVKVPLGLDCEGYREHLRQAIGDVWRKITLSLPCPPKRVWVSLGSGTLSTALRRVLPTSVELCCVNVHVLAETDERICRVRALPNTRYFSSTVPFARASAFPPPIPSNRHYDAKVWSFLCENASAGDLWWNVAR